jgi:RimJ/RimL family protein N-acetyltransferase
MSGILLEQNPIGENYAVLLRKDMDPDTIIKQLKEKQGNAEDDHYNEIFDNGGFIGIVGTWRSDPVPELGIIFHRSTWGLGFATEALTMFAELFWALKPQFNVIDAYCDTENEASMNVLRKCGFDLVEVTKGDYVLKLMTPSTRDSMHFRLTRPGST